MSKYETYLPKYDIAIVAYNSDSDERGWYSMDLLTDGNTLEDLYENATAILIDQDGGEVGQQKASGFLAEHSIRHAVMLQDPNLKRILVGRKVVGTEYGPVTYLELFQDLTGYFVVHYNREGDQEVEQITMDEARDLCNVIRKFDRLKEAR